MREVGGTYYVFRVVYSRMLYTSVLVPTDPGLHHPDAPPVAPGRDCLRVSLRWAGHNGAAAQVGEGAHPG